MGGRKAVHAFPPRWSYFINFLYSVHRWVSKYSITLDTPVHLYTPVQHPKMANRRWLFTLNNYTEEDLEHFKSLSDVVTYVIWGKEVGENGTPHLQGYLELKTRRRMNGVKELLCERVHLEIARGTQEENKKYCSKQDTEFYERGEPIRDGGSYQVQRWEAARQAAKEGKVDEIPADIYLRYKRTFDELAKESLRARRIEIVKSKRRKFDLYPWQEEVMKLIATEPDDRKVYFYVDENGGCGKSTFARRILDDPSIWSINPMKEENLAYRMLQRAVMPRTVIVDIPRATPDYKMPWDFIENLKCGSCESGKYEGAEEVFDIPHVLVFTNKRDLWLSCGQPQLSLDRIVEIIIP